MELRKALFRKIMFTLLLLQIVGFGFSQPYFNEWIRYDQTYYKFKVGKSGLYRITQSTLAAAGLGSVQVQNLELWRNGERVPFYPSVASGVLPTNGFLEFWGQPNDGKPDQYLYRNAAYQHTKVNSLIHDTAAYFLSVNTNQSGFRMTDQVNGATSSTLPVEPYFLYKAGIYFKNRINPGFAAVVGEYVYSSSFDKGEFWSSGYITPSVALTQQLTNLYVYSGGPATEVRVGAAGAASNARTIKVSINATSVLDTAMDFFNDYWGSRSLPTSVIAGGTADIRFSETSVSSSDRYVSSFLELIYPRQFNFDGQKNFEFSLPADNDGYLLEISNFDAGTVAPVLYDLSSGYRFGADLSQPGKFRFALPPSAAETKYVLVSQEPSNFSAITSLTAKNFVNFRSSSNQGNYAIIYHPVLNEGTNGRKPVDEYAAYRASLAGGNYSLLKAPIQELIDQFGYGIQKNPLGIRNFLSYCKAYFPQPLKQVFLMGRGMTYSEYRIHQNDPYVDNLDLVPTFGFPGSDNLFSADELTIPYPKIPIGRLSVIAGREVEDYLEKVIQAEAVQKNAANTLADREWMKNVVHVTGASDPFLGSVLCNFMNIYRQVIQDTLFGANVSTFCKTSSNPNEQIGSNRLDQLFEEGISVLTYFGHSSATTLEFNIDNPQNYNNPGKYPVFFVNGCNAGNFFTYYPQRLQVNETLSEKFVLAKQRGSIAFVASTHFGIVNYLNLYLNSLYNTMGKKHYGKTLGEINQYALQGLLTSTGLFDYYSRIHAEEITLHGDPALRLNLQPKPDYVIESKLITINPSFISIAEDNFKVQLKVVNLGKAIRDSVRLQIKRQLPDGSLQIIYNQKRPGIRFLDSLELSVPIVATRDKGTNKIIATIDSDQLIEEMEENNNTATREFVIFEDEARPAFPYNFSIVNDPAQKLIVSTANPFSSLKNYILEIDTTEQFNSVSKRSQTLSASGGILEFAPGLAYTDSTVYYWRVSPAASNPGDYRWNAASFLYLQGGKSGFNQSHYYQFKRSTYDNLSLDSATRLLKFGSRFNSVFIRNGVYPTSASYDNDFSITVNNDMLIRSACVGRSLIFNVFDPVTLQPWKNVDANGNSLNLYGSGSASCGSGRMYNFEFSYMTPASRKKMMDFMDTIPAGFYVAVRSIDTNIPNSFSATWRSDTIYYGSNNSLYHRLLAAGFTDIDSLNRPQCWAGMYKKKDPDFQPQFKFSSGIYDAIILSLSCPSPDTVGYITSPRFGPARQWDQVIWNGKSLESAANDQPFVEVIGINAQNQETVLYVLDQYTRSLDISSVSAATYPYIKLRMRNQDNVTLTPFQLSQWRLYYQPVPEGALAPNLFFAGKDTLEIGEPLQFRIVFKNISNYDFDSLRLKLTILDKNNVAQSFTLPRQKPLRKGDTLLIRLDQDTKNFIGKNILFLEVNPENDQPEQFHFNNFLYWNFYVKPDQVNPLLDVTFDGVHILNQDIVSAKPHILIKLKDEARYLLLNDTSLTTVQIRFPNGTLKTFRFDNDTLRFTPATSGSDNTAEIQFTPQFAPQSQEAGDEYELIVGGKDRSNNKAGETEYRVAFRVISKPMISNLLNYPNPFSTSTAFVFTLTGSEVPEQFKIQILTVTGKIVREITKDELGPLHIGRNITDYRWDGTDQFGQRLANGVYLYRVVTSLNGKGLDKYKSEGESTNQFFQNG
ncbi:MAG: C25 family cysteine peptidase, partial [Chitinophagaceae bacterium]